MKITRSKDYANPLNYKYDSSQSFYSVEYKRVYSKVSNTFLNAYSYNYEIL